MVNIDKNKRFSAFFDHYEAKREIEFLVLHHIEANSVDDAIAQLIKHEVSSHYIIDETGTIYELVAPNDIAYHAGVSYWNGVEGLNKHSIGIEFVTPDAFAQGYNKQQMQSGIALARHIIDRYAIKPQNIVGHSDIAYVRHNGLLDRKQDPSHLFDWKLMSEHGIAIYPDITIENDAIVFKKGDEDLKIAHIKQALAAFGYKVNHISPIFDDEMVALTRVFHRHFNQTTFGSDPDLWYHSSQLILNQLTHAIT